MTPLGKLILFGAIAVVIYAVVTGNHSEKTKATVKQPPAPGWEQLESCSPMQSLDDTRELAFLEDHTVTLEEKEAKTGKVLTPNALVGTWSFDELAKRYFVTLGQQKKSYALIQPENSEVCILLYGELAAANLSESWFGRTLQDQYDDRDPPDPH
jgi:hypothetical protein